MSRSVLYELSDEVLVKNKKNIKFKARGSSMRPFIKDGDIVEVQPIGNTSIKSGDVLLFKSSPETICLHRVIKIKGNKFTIKGDASRRIDGIVESQNIIGKLNSIERNGSPVQITGISVNRILNRLFAFSQLWHAIANPLKKTTKFIIRPAHSFVLSISFIRKNLKKYASEKMSASVAQPSDAYDICLIYRQPYPEDIKKVAEDIRVRQGIYIISRFKNQIIGVTSLHYENKKGPWGGWWLTGLVVKGKFRGFGAGKSIVELAIDITKKNNGRALKLLAFEGRRPAYDLYAKLGFERVIDPEMEKQLEKESEKGFQRRIYMIKNLTNSHLFEESEKNKDSE